jgi:ribosomal protein L33
MLAATHTTAAPWTLVDFNDQRRGRLTLVRNLLDRLPDTRVDVAPLDLPAPIRPHKERFGLIDPIPTFAGGPAKTRTGFFGTHPFSGYTGFFGVHWASGNHGNERRTLDIRVILPQRPAPVARIWRGGENSPVVFAGIYFSGQRFRIATWPSPTVKIRLVSTANTGFFYVTKIRATPPRSSASARRPVARKHVEFKEAKIK